MKRALGTIFIFLILLFYPKIIFASSEITISTSTTSVTALDEFSITLSAQGLDSSTTYSLKAVGGDSNYDIQIKGSDNSWKNFNTNWSEMPTATSDSEGKINTSLTLRFRSETKGGDKSILGRIRKISTETNIDSNTLSIQVTALPDPTPTATPTTTPSPSPTPTVSPTPTSTAKATIQPVPTAPPSEEEIMNHAQILGDSIFATPASSGYDFMQASPSPGTDYTGGSSKTAIVLMFAGIGFIGIALFPFLKHGLKRYNTNTQENESP